MTWMKPKVAKDLLLEVNEIFQKTNISLILSQGVLLGAIRENRILPWDNDIDFWTLSPDSTLDSPRYSEILKAVENLRNHGFEYWEFYKIPDGKIVHWSFRKRNTPVCLKILCPANNPELLCETGIYWKGRKPTISLLPIRLFDPPATIEFLGTKFFVPNPPKEFLDKEYGNWHVVKQKHVTYTPKRSWPTFWASECPQSPWEDIKRFDTPIRLEWVAEQERKKKERRKRKKKQRGG